MDDDDEPAADHRRRTRQAHRPPPSPTPGGGKVTETEVGDEDSYYEVEVTLDDGTQVDVQLDEDFKVVGNARQRVRVRRRRLTCGPPGCSW